MPQRKQPTPGEIVTLASAVFILLAAFLPFYEVSSPLGSTSWNAWSDTFLIFPLVLIVVLMSVAIGVLTALAFGCRDAAAASYSGSRSTSSTLRFRCSSSRRFSPTSCATPLPIRARA